MPLQIVRNDITKMECDAIVNAANSSLLGGGGVDGAIHQAAGKKLLAECKTLGGCKTGEAKLTKGYRLPSRFVIHTVGPVWQGGGNDEEKLLRDCYRHSLALAKEHDFETVAFPLISSGAYGYPKDQALKIATEEIAAFLDQNEMTVYLVVFDKAAYQIGEERFSKIAAFIDDKYVNEHILQRTSQVLSQSPAPAVSQTLAMPLAPSPAKAVPQAASLEEALQTIDESFSEMLLRKIDEKGMSDSACYKKANIDRKLFSKIRGDRLYRPSKTTAIAFAIALELPLEEARDMLQKAGFALSHSNKFDIIIEYFITQKNYNIFEINEALFAFDQALLGV